MPSKGRMFAGCTVALLTPFENGEVDYESLKASVDWQIEQGTPVISPVGTTGESPTLSHDEHEKVIAAVVAQAAGKAKVLAGTGSNSTSEAVRLTKFAAKAGADGALVVSPYYNRPTQEGIYAHYAKIAESSDLPIVVYNVPGRTGRNVEPDTIDQVSDLLARTDLTVLSGDDSLTLPMMAVGAEGVISVAANLVPRDIMAMIDAFNLGNLVEARRLHLKLFPLCRDLLGLAPNPIPVKTAVMLVGRGNGEMRLPLLSPDSKSLENLKGTLTRYGVL